MGASSSLELRELKFRRAQSNWTFDLIVEALALDPERPRAVLGSSGCGKSTLLDLLSFTLYPDTVGSFLLHTPDGQLDIAALLARKSEDLAFVRGRYMGYVLQQGGLLPFMTARENIRLPAELFSVEESHDIDELAATLGIESCLDKRPISLSVGERQRVSIARALFHRPHILIADEPTASIDASNATQLAELLLTVVQRYKVALLVATHDQSIVSAMQLEPLTLETRAGETGSVTTIKG